MDKVFYNQASEKKLGWEPYWFGARQNDEECVEAIAAWQEEAGITADGLCGPSTYRRIWTEREEDISSNVIYHIGPTNGRHPNASRLIVHNGHFYPIDWDVVLWDNPSALASNYGTFYDYAGEEDRKPSFFINHWDVCLSSTSCSKILDKRGISVHFCIDNDGTIHQLLDTQHGAWHAGGKEWNHKSIGVEISNAFYPKYQDHYVRHGFGKRPVIKDAVVHGNKVEEHLGFYPVQLQAAQALWKAISEVHGIPLEYPKDKNGNLDTGVNKECADGDFKGFCNHYNLTKRKIDCAGMKLDRLINEVKDG